VADIIRTGLVANLDAKLVDELLQAHADAKRSYFLGGLRLAEVEGGRFCEAALRLMQLITTGTFTPVGRQLDSESIIRALASLPSATFSDSIRIHIPRAVRLVYDIRNKRDAAHLADGIDPNLQDAVLVISVIDWILAEFVRLYHNVSPDDAQRLVEDLVTRQAPIVQDFEGHLKVLNPKLGASDHVLVVLYQRGTNGATYNEIESWLRPKMRSNLRRTLARLETERDLVHYNGSIFLITRLGQREVERRRLVDPTA
jgi:hypothetical protein